jgi:hypothetical protein
MSNEIRVISIRPQATEDEVVTVGSALALLWPTQQLQRLNQRDTWWRFSGRRRVASTNPAAVCR